MNCPRCGEPIPAGVVGRHGTCCCPNHRCQFGIATKSLDGRSHEERLAETARAKVVTPRGDVKYVRDGSRNLSYEECVTAHRDHPFEIRSDGHARRLKGIGSGTKSERLFPDGSSTSIWASWDELFPNGFADLYVTAWPR
jgi:hypothetical protein